MRRWAVVFIFDCWVNASCSLVALWLSWRCIDVFPPFQLFSISLRENNYQEVH